MHFPLALTNTRHAFVAFASCWLNLTRPGMLTYVGEPCSAACALGRRHSGSFLLLVLPLAYWMALENVPQMLSIRFGRCKSVSQHLKIWNVTAIVWFWPAELLLKNTREKQNFLIAMLELRPARGWKGQVLERRNCFSWWMRIGMTNFQGKVLSKQRPWQDFPETRLHGYLEAHRDLIFTRKMVCEIGLQNIICLPILLLASFIFSPRAFASENLKEKSKRV